MPNESCTWKGQSKTWTGPQDLIQYLNKQTEAFT